VKRDTINYFYVGLAVLIALALLLGALFGMTGSSGGGRDSYLVRYQNVSGLGYGSAVFYQGYRIGQVEKITPEQQNGKTSFRVDFSVQKDWKMPADSVASLLSSGLLSDVFVGISEGKAAETLKIGSELKSREGGDVFAAVGALASEITDLTQNKLSPLLEKVGSSVDTISEKLQSGAPTIVDDSVRLLKQLNQGAASLNDVLGPKNRGNIDALLAQSAGAAGTARQLATELINTRAQLDMALKQINQTIATVGPDAQVAMDDLRVTIGALSQRVDAITYNLESASRHFDEFGREIRKQPNRLLFNPSQDDDVKTKRQ
jgi:phospholipid/cholesterol/gamma-HCH transport system substrate-binding protein